MIEIGLSLFLILAHLSFLIVNYSSFNFFDVSYFAGAVGLSGALSYKLLKNRPHFKLEKFELIIFLLTMTLGLLLVGARSIWIDEYSQYLASIRFNQYFSLSNSAGIEQQPPFGYLVSWVASLLFGNTIVGLRFFSLLSMSLALIYISRILRNYSVNRWITCIALVYFMTRVNIFEFFVEGRPYALAIFFSLLTLDYYSDLFHRRRELSCIQLCTYLFFLVNSIGMQAQIFAASLFVAYALLGGALAWRRVLLCNLLAATLFIPTFINIVNLSNQVSQFKDEMTLTSFFEALSIQFKVLLNGLLNHVPFSWEIWALWIVFTLALVFKLKRGGFILVVALAFVSSYLLLYVYFINWTLYLKYYILLVPLMVIMAAIGIGVISERFYVVRTKFNALVLVCISLAYGSILFNGFVRKAELLIDNRVMPWKSVYAFLSSHVKDQDTVYFLTFNEAGEWSLVKPVGANFYLQNKQANLVGEKYIPGSFVTLPDFKKSNKVEGEVYVVSPYYWSNDHLDDEVLIYQIPELEVTYVDGVRIYKIKMNGDTDNQRLITLLQNAVDYYSNFPWTFSLRMSLVRLYALEGNTEAHARELDAMKKMWQPTRRNITGMSTNREGIVREVTPFLKMLP